MSKVCFSCTEEGEQCKITWDDGTETTIYSNFSDLPKGSFELRGFEIFARWIADVTISDDHKAYHLNTFTTYVNKHLPRVAHSAGYNYLDKTDLIHRYGTRQKFNAINVAKFEQWNPVTGSVFLSNQVPPEKASAIRVEEDDLTRIAHIDWQDGTNTWIAINFDPAVQADTRKGFDVFCHWAAGLDQPILDKEPYLLLDRFLRNYSVCFDDKQTKTQLSITDTLNAFKEKKPFTFIAPKKFTCWNVKSGIALIRNPVSLSKSNQASSIVPPQEVPMTSTKDAAVEAMEMGALAALLESLAKRLLVRIGADPTNDLLVKGTATALPLLLRYVALPIVGDAFPKREQLEYHLSLAFQGTAVVASYEVTKVVLDSFYPILVELSKEPAALLQSMGEGEVFRTKEKVRSA